MSTIEELFNVFSVVTESKEDERVLKLDGTDGLAAVLVEGEEVLL